MIPKAFDAIGKEDIDALVENTVCEKRDTEYKEQLPGGSDEDKKDFLANVSSLANTSGGDLIYGVRDKRDANTGQPTGSPEAVGLAETNPVAQETRLVNLVRDGIDPRIPGIRINHFGPFPLGPIIVLRVPKSWASPHMIKFRLWSRFYSRTSAGKHPLDVQEIRLAFTASESLAEKISAFRSDRVGKILAGEAPVALVPGPKLVLHLLPLQAFSEPVAVDLRAAQARQLEQLGLIPMMWPGMRLRPSDTGWGPSEFNFDGLFCPTRGGSQTASYVQLFRSGAIEAVCSWTSQGKSLSGGMLDEVLVRAAHRYMRDEAGVGVRPPLYVAVSAISVKGFGIVPSFTWASTNEIDRDVLLAPAALVEEEEANIEMLLRPALESIWQASGWPGSQVSANAGNA